MSEDQFDSHKTETIQLILDLNFKETTFHNVGELNWFISEFRSQIKYLIRPDLMEVGSEEFCSKVYKVFYKPYIDFIEKLASMWESHQYENLDDAVSVFNETFVNFPVVTPKSKLFNFIKENKASNNNLAACMLFLSFKPTHVIRTSLGDQLNNSYSYFISENSSESRYLVDLYNTFSRANRLLSKWEVIGSEKPLSALINEVKTLKREAQKSLEEIGSNLQHYSDSASNVFNSLDNKKDELHDWIHNFKANLEEEKEIASSKSKDTFNKLLKKSIQHKRSVTKKVNQDIQESKARLALSEKTYNEKVALNESVGYWGAKETLHSDEMRNWGISLIASMILTLILPLFVSVTIHDYTKADVADKLFFGVVNPLSATGLLITLSLCTYAIRFCSRQFSSAKHLKLEATERKTMIRTYLALMNEDKLKEAEDRKVALDTMFRPSQTGIVADNQSVMPTDSVIKVLTRQQKA